MGYLVHDCSSSYLPPFYTLTTRPFPQPSLPMGLDIMDQAKMQGQDPDLNAKTTDNMDQTPMQSQDPDLYAKTTDSIGATEARRVPLARLEQLPTELLETICIESANPNMLRASQHLAACLDSDPVTTGLVFSLLSRWYCYGQGRLIPSDLDTHVKPIFVSDFNKINKLSEGYVLNDETTRLYWNEEKKWRAQAERHLLQTARCTPQLLVQCKERLFLDLASMLIKNALITQDLATQQVAVESMIEELTRPEEESNVGTQYPSRTWQYEIPLEVPTTLIVEWHRSCRFPHEFMQVTLFKDSEATEFSPWETPLPVERHIFIGPSYYGVRGTPPQLLRGPWNQAKADFLALTITDRVPSRVSRERCPLLLKGLEDALRDCCIPAVLALLNVPGRNTNEITKVAIALNRVQEVTDSLQRAGFFQGDGAGKAWNVYASPPSNLRRTWQALATNMSHFELLFDSTANPKVMQLGLAAFKALLVLFCKEALLAGTVTRLDVVQRLQIAQRDGASAMRWGPWRFLRNGIGFVKKTWDIEEKKHHREVAERRVKDAEHASKRRQRGRDQSWA